MLFRSLADELATAAAVRAPRARALDAVQTRHAPVLDAEARGGRERRVERRVFRREERFRPRVGGAGEVEPERHLTVSECVRLALAEAQLALGDRLVAAAALCSAARRAFDDVWHARIIGGTAARASLLTDATGALLLLSLVSVGIDR